MPTRSPSGINSGWPNSLSPVENSDVRISSDSALKTARSLFSLSLRDLDGTTRLEFGRPPWEGFALFLLQAGNF